MRVLLLTHYFPPEVGAPQTRLAELAAGLARRGHEVTVHTAPPHYPDGVIRAPYDNRPLRRERASDGVRVVRSAVYATPNRGIARRLLNHLSHAASALATAPATGPCDVVVAESPPLFTAAAGVLYARAKRAPLVLNVADLWPETAVELGVMTAPGPVAAAQALASACYAGAAAIAVPTEGMVERLDAIAAARGKALRIPPAVAVERFDAAAPPPPDGPLRVLYAGTVGHSQGIGTLIDAVARAGEGVELTLAGSGAEAGDVRAEVERRGAANVRFAGMVARDEVPALYAAHHAGAVVLRDRRLFDAALPTKLLEVMAAGRAAVVSARGDSAALVEGAGAGVAVAPEDGEALAAALRDLAGDRERVRRLGEAGRRHVERHFRRDTMVDRWAALLESVAGG
ncbi:MAG TPA: glycosyltransferase family 4 protein [Solirubrobacteraceae bacterium]